MFCPQQSGVRVDLVQQVCDFFRRHIGNRGAKKSFPFPNFLSLRRGPQIGNNRYVLLLYITKELFLYFFISFLFFFMIFFVNQILLLAEDVLKKRVPVLDVIRLMTYSLPFIIAQSAPFATLVGFLMCLGRMMSDNEILVMRITGLSYFSIFVPVFLLGTAISFVSFFVNDYLLPLGTISYNKLYMDILYSDPTIELESDSIKRTDRATLVIGDVTEDTVSDLLFFDTDSNGATRVIVAGKTQIRNSEKPGTLMNLHMDSSTVFSLVPKNPKTYDVMTAGKTEMNIFTSSLFHGSDFINPREMTSYDLYRFIEEEKKRENSFIDFNMYRLEFHKKFSLPFASVFFAMLALPLAILFGKHNGQTVGLIIGIFFCVLYWAAMIIGQNYGIRDGLNGFWVMWGPDFAIGVIALFFHYILVKK